MALCVNLKSVENLQGKADRIARCSFRDHVLNSKVVRSAKNAAYFGEMFEWPIARMIEPSECVYLEILNHSRYLSDKVLGTFTLCLQQVIQDGCLTVSETLTDRNNRVTQEVVTFEVKYYSPDGKVGDWNTDQFSYPLIEDVTDGSKVKGQSYVPEVLDETAALREIDIDGMIEAAHHDTDSLGGQSQKLAIEDGDSNTMMVEQMYQVKKKRPEVLEHELHKPRDFSVSITIIEGMQFSGLDIDPVIKVQIGDQFRYTTIKKSSNNPFYNEFFAFEFHESPAMIFDKMITIRAMHSYGLPGRQVLRAGNLIAGRLIGEFKCDIGTVYAEQDHTYYHKWAVLVHPKEASEGPKGFIKCDISVLGKGDAVRAPKHNVKDDDTADIASNLLLPAGVPMERQRAYYQMIIYRGEDLPRTNLGLFASVKKAMGGAPEAFIDAMVKIHFAGQVYKTSSKKQYHPEWREVITFSDMFPPLCNRIKVELCDNDVTADEVIATHFIELSQIMDPGGESDGILPTFGPSWINFYGAPRNYKMLEEHEDLNAGLGEGAAFRGRILMQIKTEIQDEESGSGNPTAFREKLRTSSEVQVAPRRQFLLFSTVMGATMIDKDLARKNIHFEISIGQFGNSLDAKAGKSFTSNDADTSSDEEEEDADESRLLKQKKKEEANLPCHSTTKPETPKQMPDKNYLYMPYEGEKPCTYTISIFEDLRKRMYHANLLEHIYSIIEDGLEDVRQMLKDDHESSHRRLRGVLGEFTAAISTYLRLVGNLGIGAGSGKTQLDKFRLKACKKQLDKVKSAANDIKGKIKKENVREKYRESKDLARKVKQLTKEPQHAIPDVFVWMVCEKTRIAYARINSRELLHATQDDMMGKNCGKTQTVFLKKPGKKSTGAAGWVMQAKLDLFMWLGEYTPGKTAKEYLKGLPPGYEIPDEFKKAPTPPKLLVYPECHTFQLRAYLFQARNLLGSDDTGLSDPFVRVLVQNNCQQSQVIEQTLNPTFDETLVFNEVKVYGPIDEIAKNPPLVICEVFDYDMVGKPEFLGRAFIKPKVKPQDVSYDLPEFPPQLEWWDVYRGARAAGEILGSFELLEGSQDEFAVLPEKVPGKWKESIKVIPLPQTIKPTLSRYRVEALFWGVREMKRVQLLSVDRPKVELEIGGKALSSKKIEQMANNCNFEDNVHYMDVDLPDNKLYWPPITIRVMDCRQFGREVLVGTHTIGDSERFYKDPEQDDIGMLRRATMLPPITEGGLNLLGQPAGETSDHEHNGSVVVDMHDGHDVNSVVINMSQHTGSRAGTHMEGSVRGSRAGTLTKTDVPSVAFAMPDVKQPLNGHLPGQPLKGEVEDPSSQQAPKPAKRKKKKELIAELDWWSKYYVTKEDLARPEEEFEEMYKHLSPAEERELKQFELMTKEEREKKRKEKKNKALCESDEDLLEESDYRDLFPNVVDYGGLDEDQLDELRELAEQKRKEEEDAMDKKNNKKKKKRKNPLTSMKGVINEAFTKDDEAGMGGNVSEEDMEDKSFIKRIKVYDCELEKVRAFDGLVDHFETFILYRGRLDDDEEIEGSRVAGKFKGNLRIYKTDDVAGDDDTKSVDNKSIVSVSKVKIDPKALLKKLHHMPILKLAYRLPSPKPFEVQVAVYVIKCLDLYPTDLNGKTDPYLYMTCGKKVINDKENKQFNQLNPVFGKMFEFDAALPMDSYLRIQVYDYDLIGTDDMIGETVIDLENRYHSKHRATCGIQQEYDTFGYNAWRDPQKPTQIVAKLCKGLRIEPPEYKASSVNIAGKSYKAEGEIENEAGDMIPTHENLALEVLKNWQDVPGGCKLVPEHIETRGLYSPTRPGVELGRMEMWIDMFPKDMPPPTTTVDITPRLPKDYELRVIIWNTDDVVLEDTNFLTGEASSDIFVKGYLKGVGEDDQQTDVHYRSLTGEGNFNWRYIFPFEYLKAEEKIMYKKKVSIFDLEETEVKIPPKLTVQVWDADLISSDDFLGSITMDLNHIPRPAKDAKHCKMSMLKKDGSVPCFNIFKQKRSKGWWPMEAKGGEEGHRLVGKVEAELILMTKDEAEKSPAGHGRDEPDPLAEPNRPDTSFFWLFNPWKTLRYIIWENYKWIILKLFLLILLIVFIGLFIYNMPQASVNKVYGLL